MDERSRPEAVRSSANVNAAVPAEVTSLGTREFSCVSQFSLQLA